jgi:hypothetical protein
MYHLLGDTWTFHNWSNWSSWSWTQSPSSNREPCRNTNKANNLTSCGGHILCSHPYNRSTLVSSWIWVNLPSIGSGSILCKYPGFWTCLDQPIAIIDWSGTLMIWTGNIQSSWARKSPNDVGGDVGCDWTNNACRIYDRGHGRSLTQTCEIRGREFKRHGIQSVSLP